jgi:signal transduction histidine kinase
MTRRITAAFLGVLFVFLAIVVVPLGLIDTRRIHADFRDATTTTAQALAAVAEEHVDDGRGGSLRIALSRSMKPGDGVLVRDRTGRAVARVGVSVAPGDDREVVAVPIGPAAHPAGALVFSRDEEPAEARVRTLWLLLSGAAVLALGIGAVVAWLLGRWIATPLRSLIRAAGSVGAGDVAARADAADGPAQVRDVAAAFNEMADRVSGLLDAQASMTADVSHQLRTPLAALRLRLDLLVDEVPDDQRPEVVGMISETARLSRLVDGLLAVAQADAAIAAPRSVDVGAVCAERISSWEPLAAERGIRLDLATGRRCLARATPGHLEQILDNALANALDALPAGGTVKLEVAKTPADVHVRIADDGPGMSELLRERAFDRFVTDRRGDGGTGLGLAIVGRLIAADHGSVELLDTDGGGLTLLVRLPAASRR